MQKETKLNEVARWEGGENIGVKQRGFAIYDGINGGGGCSAMNVICARFGETSSIP